MASLLDVLQGNAPQQQWANLPYTPTQSPSGLGIDYLKKRWQEINTPQKVNPMTPQEAMDWTSIAPLGITKIAGTAVNEILYPNRTLDSLTSAEKSAMTKFTKSLGNPSFRLREELKLTGGGNEITPNLEMLTPQGIHPEQLLDKVLTPVAGDQSATGGVAKKIAGIPLEREIPQQGGRMYPFIKDVNKENTGWASMEDAATSKQNNFIKNENKFGGRDVLGIFQSLGDEGINFSHHQAPTMVAQLSVLKPPAEAIKMFDSDMRALTFKNKKTGKVTQPFKNFSGVTSSNIYDQMLNGVEGEFSAGNLNKAIAELMAKDKYQKIGFPSYSDANKAMSESGLYTGASGKTIFQADTSRGLLDPTFKHGSYNKGIPRKEGGLLGGIMNAEGQIVSVPDEIMFRKTFEELRKQGKRDDRIRRSMMMSHKGEVADEQTVEGIMKYLGYLPK
jgi:hypothetical protein